MTRLVIVSTMPGGSVAITIPAPEFIDECARGMEASRAARGYIEPPIDVEREVAKLMRNPAWRPDLTQKEREALARRRYEAMRFGGLSEMEAVELIRDCDCPPWSTAREIVDVSEIPPDRTYRDAWRRSPNGGPIYIDQTVARQLRDARIGALQ